MEFKKVVNCDIDDFRVDPSPMLDHVAIGNRVARIDYIGEDGNGLRAGQGLPVAFLVPAELWMEARAAMAEAEQSRTRAAKVAPGDSGEQVTRGPG